MVFLWLSLLCHQNTTIQQVLEGQARENDDTLASSKEMLFSSSFVAGNWKNKTMTYSNVDHQGVSKLDQPFIPCAYYNTTK